jgi:hypothetical protein
MRWTGHVVLMWERGGAYRVLVGKPHGKIPLGKPRHRSNDNVKMDLQEMGWGSKDWIDVVQDRTSGGLL